MNGAVTARFVCVPREAVFGIRPAGSVVEETLCLRNRRPGSFVVAKVDVDNPAVRVEAQAGPVGEVLYRIRWKLGDPGEKKATLSFLVRDGELKEHRVSFAARGYATKIE